MGKLLAGVMAAFLCLFSTANAQGLPNPFDTCNTCRRPAARCGCGHQHHAVAPRRVAAIPQVNCAQPQPIPQPQPQMTYAPAPQVCQQPPIVQAPPPQVMCVQPQPVVQTHTQLRPVMETQYRQEQYTIYKDVPRIDYRVEQQAVNVPVTTYRQVTVDEGGFQQVWVPKLVTKSIPQTVYQQQMVCKTVPVQTTQRVAEMATRTVPYQSVRYVPQTFQTVTMPQPACATCLPTTAMAPGSVGMAYPYPTTVGAYPYATVPQTAAVPQMVTPLYGQPIANNSDPLTTIKSRHQKQDRLSDIFGGDEEDSLSRREQRRELKSSVRSAKRFSAPSAATVWQAQGNTVLR